MTSERRYTDEEVKAILENAADRSAGLPAVVGADPAPKEGFTLAELQEIASEAGIAPEHVTAAAGALSRSHAVASPSLRPLGLPLTVARTRDLPRQPTDEEWRAFVGELQETFRAPGTDERLGRLRRWRNGQLHAVVEPTDDGWRLRMGSLNDTSRALMAGGAAAVGLALLITLLNLLGVARVDAGDVAIIWGLVGSLGVGLTAAGAARLPKWARTREEQMEALSSSLEARLRSGGTREASEGSSASQGPA